MTEEGLIVLDESVALSALDLLAVRGEAEVGAVDLLGDDPLAAGEALGLGHGEHLLLVGVLNGGVASPLFGCGEG